jgi:hypothetical protein
MNDTSPEIAAMMHRRYAGMSPVERFMIGVQMFETARVLVLASLPPDLAQKEKRKMLCERLYGKEIANKAYGEAAEPARVEHVGAE